jgi:hypothetical protein
MSEQLTDEQYEKLLQEEGSLDTLINHGWMKNLSHHYLSALREIYMNVFSAPPLNTGCPSCISIAIHKLWPVMQAKKLEYQKREEDKVIQETLRIRDEKLKVDAGRKTQTK